MRPICSSCGERSVECFYDVREGQTRQNARQEKQERYERELGNARELIQHLQYASEADVQATLRELRAKKGSFTSLKTLKTPIVGRPAAENDRTSLPVGALAVILNDDERS